MDLKEKISNEAMQWIDTPFHHQGRAKNIGVDCIGLIVGIAKNLDLKSEVFDATNNRQILLHELDNPNYSPLPNRMQLKDSLTNTLIEIEKGDLNVGDIILFTLNMWPQHVAIITKIQEDIFFVHASEPVGKTIFSRFDSRWQDKAIGFYRFPELKKGD